MELQRFEIDTGDVALSCIAAGEGPLVLAQHGFPDRRETFLPILEPLVRAGLRVVMPTLRGYAPSGVARSGRHDALAAAEDLRVLADRLSPDAPVRLVGHDWGALAASIAAALTPERVHRLVTMAVPHGAAFLRNTSLAQLRRSSYMGLFQLRFIAEAKLARDDFAFVDELWRRWSPGHVASREELAAVKEGLRDRVGPALAYYRALFSLRTIANARRALGEIRVPAIHVHGEDDGCVGVASTRGAERFYAAGYELFVIPRAGHFLTHDAPAEVGAIVAQFLAP